MPTTLSRKDGALTLVVGDWYAFCQAFCKGFDEEDWEEMYDSYKVMSGAVGVKKPQEAKTERKSFVIRLAIRTVRKGIKRVWSCGKNISRIQLPLWTKHQSVLKVSIGFGSRPCYGPYGELCFFLLKKEPMALRELVRLEPSIRPHGELLLLFKEPACVPDS